jgi:tRNA nucleotidyltransferase (CCA-adding enzyme)
MPDYMFLLESRLSPEQHAAVVRIQELAQLRGSNVYLTGGAVRDLISGMPIRDLDFTLEGNPAWIAKELAKGGAQVVRADERRREIEFIFTGDVDGSVAAARDEIYALPGTRPEIRWATIMEDLRRRDFSINAIAISLNPASRGLLLDPTIGLADLEKREVRALSIHCFTNQPVRLLRIVRYSTRLGFKIEPRSGEWFQLALDRGLHRAIPPADVGREARQLAREESPTPILKAWEAHGLVGAIHPQLPRRHPDYEGLARIARVSEAMAAAGVRPRLFAPVTFHLLARLRPLERSATLRRLEFTREEIGAVATLDARAQEAVRILRGRKTALPRDAYSYLEKLPRDLLAFVQARYPHPKAMNKIRNYLRKWRPLRLQLPVAELDSLGIARGPQFDKILEDLFEMQLRGRGVNPQDRSRLLRRFAGIKPPKKPTKQELEKEKKRVKQEKKAAAAPAPTPGISAGSKPAPAAAQKLPAASKPGRGPRVPGVPTSLSGAPAAAPPVPRPATPKKRGGAKPVRRPRPPAKPAKRSAKSQRSRGGKPRRSRR